MRFETLSTIMFSANETPTLISSELANSNTVLKGPQKMAASEAQKQTTKTVVMTHSKESQMTSASIPIENNASSTTNTDFSITLQNAVSTNAVKTPTFTTALHSPSNFPNLSHSLNMSESDHITSAQKGKVNTTKSATASTWTSSFHSLIDWPSKGKNEFLLVQVKTSKTMHDLFSGRFFNSII
ncbi:hypothetical protein AB6A40_009654 [Gnathostoma spinigerum]|uniref:Uncharacterized protein n=1 Tax=Gnathostoma spinigerum TaxID=75299 RepID=A0ABD6ETU4_9BILA